MLKKSLRLGVRFSESMLVLFHAALDFDLWRPADHDGATRPLRRLFYYFRLEDQVPEHHLLRLIDKHISFEFVRQQLKDSYSELD